MEYSINTVTETVSKVDNTYLTDYKSIDELVKTLEKERDIRKEHLKTFLLNRDKKELITKEMIAHIVEQDRTSVNVKLMSDKIKEKYSVTSTIEMLKVERRKG